MKYEVGMKVNVNGAHPIFEEIVYIYERYIVTKGNTYSKDCLSMYYIEDDGYWTPYFSNEDHAFKPIVKDETNE